MVTASNNRVVSLSKGVIEKMLVGRCGLKYQIHQKRTNVHRHVLSDQTVSVFQQSKLFIKTKKEVLYR